MRVVVSGTFDLLHVGHLRLLKQAKERFGWVLASVNSDRFCVEQKRKPVVPCEHRVEMLRGVKYVDEVCVVDWEFGPFAKSTAAIDSFLVQFQLDALFCGCDDSDYVAKWFGHLSRQNKVFTVPRTPAISTSQIIEVVTSSQESL